MERANGGQDILNTNECSRIKMEIKFKNALIAYWNKAYMRDIEGRFGREYIMMVARQMIFKAK